MSTATATKPDKKKAETTSEIKVSEAVNTLAGIFETGIKVEKDGNVTVEDGLIENNLPEDLSMAQIKRVQKHRGEVVAALTLAVSRKALPVLNKNKDLDKVHTSVKIGGDKLDVAIERQREFNDGNGGKVMKYGYASIGYTASGATNAGDFKKVRAIVADEAKALFS